MRHVSLVSSRWYSCGGADWRSLRVKSKHLVQRMDALSKVQDSSSNGNSHQGRQQMHVDYDLGQGFTCEAVV